MPDPFWRLSRSLFALILLWLVGFVSPAQAQCGVLGPCSGSTGSGSGTPANPTATAGPAAVNGAASTYMRSDAAPAVQKATGAQFGIVEGDGSTVTLTGGVISVTNPAPSAANPTATAGPAVNNGSAATFMRSDASPIIQKATNAQFGLAECDGQTLTCAAGVASATAPDRTASGPTIAATDMGGQVNASGGTVTIPATSSTIFASGMQSIIVNTSGGGPLTVATTPTINNCPSTLSTAFFLTSNGTSLDCILVGNVTLNATGQILTGGFHPTAFSIGTISSGTSTVDCGNGPIQTLTDGGAFTLAMSANDGNCTVRVTNNGSAGAITFSGFSEGSNTGDALTTTNTSKFDIVLTRIGGNPHYLVSALQ